MANLNHFDQNASHMYALNNLRLENNSQQRSQSTSSGGASATSISGTSSQGRNFPGHAAADPRPQYLQLSTTGVRTTTTRRSLPAPSPSANCTFCGYVHSGLGSSGNSSNAGDDRGDKKGGDPPNKKGNGKGCDDDKGKGGGDADRGSGGSGRGGGGGGGGGGDGGGGGGMNGDDPQICPDQVTTFLFLLIGSAVLLFLIVTFACQGSESFSDCIMSGSGCGLNDNMENFFGKSGISRNRSGSRKGALEIPGHLRSKYDEIKKVLQRTNCMHAIEEGPCEVPNYATQLAGAKIVNIGKTEVIATAADPTTIIREESRLYPGACWGFAGVGEVRIQMFYPIIVLGVTIRHPSSKKVDSSYLTSAPKDFELKGYHNLTDKNPHDFGKFLFKAEGGWQMFEVPNPTSEKYEQVMFRFLSNHGNPNYTAIYKVEVHGLMDPSSPQSQ